MKSNTIIDILKYIPVLLMSMIVHSNWWNAIFSKNTVFIAGDWYLWNNTSLHEIGESVWGTWYPFTNFGNYNLQIFSAPWRMIWVLLGELGLNFNQITLVTMLLPISILSFFAPYILLTKYFKIKYYLAYILSFWWGMSYFLIIEQSTHIQIALSFAIFPLYFLLMNEYINASYIKKILSILLSIIYFSIEPRIFLVSLLILSLYWLFNCKNIAKLAKEYILFIFVFILGISYYVLPNLMLKNSAAAAEITSREMFSPQIYSLLQTVTVGIWKWKDNAISLKFEHANISGYMLITPLLISISLYLLTIKKNISKNTLFFILILIIGIILSKNHTEPYRDLYYLFFKYIPIAKLYREPTKFYLLIQFGILGILAYTTRTFISKKIKKRYLYAYLLSILIIPIIILNFAKTNPNFSDMWIPKTNPNDYVDLNNKLSETSLERNKVLCIPLCAKWIDFSLDNQLFDFIKVKGRIDEYASFDLFLEDNNITHVIIDKNYINNDNNDFLAYAYKDSTRLNSPIKMGKDIIYQEVESNKQELYKCNINNCKSTNIISDSPHHFIFKTTSDNTDIYLDSTFSEHWILMKNGSNWENTKNFFSGNYISSSEVPDNKYLNYFPNVSNDQDMMIIYSMQYYYYLGILISILGILFGSVLIYLVDRYES